MTFKSKFFFTLFFLLEIMILKTAVQYGVVAQDFDLEPFAIVVDHSKMMKTSTIEKGSNSKFCINSPSLTAVFRMIQAQENHSFTGWNRVYLATYPRSGNHWMRYLIEEATGIATSSVYKDPDPPHLDTIFRWGGFCCDLGYEGNCRYPLEGETVVVKTHYPVFKHSLFDQLPCSKVIRIIRNPIDSFYSFYTYEQHFNGQLVCFMIPRDIVEHYIESWRSFQEYWDTAENVVTIRYEDLQQDPVKVLSFIFDNLDYNVTKDDIKRAVEKYPPEGNMLKHIRHFTNDDLASIQNQLSDLLEKYHYN